MRGSQFDIGNTYFNPAVWAAHTREMLAVRDYAASHGAELIVVIFPMLGDVKGSSGLTARLADFWRKNNTRVVDLAPVLEHKTPSELTANPFDAHPGPATHAITAQHILKQIRQAKVNKQGRSGHAE